MPKNLKTDLGYMQRAIQLSRRGFPAPNPHVGCVLVKHGNIIGEGFHAYAWADHAEAMALKKAGVNATDATAYVTLEPCNHLGRTPPCSQALIQAGVQRVVFACPDPNPSAKGGADTLRSVGVEVEHLAELEQLARAANELFLAAYKRHRATITLKAAIGADGRIALPGGESKWITGEPARKAGHRLRAEMGCVLIGAGTLLKDDPILTARIPGVRNQPLKLVLLDRSLAHRSFRAENLQAIFWDGEQWRVTPVSDARPMGPGQLESLPAALFAQGIIGVLVEGGAITHSRFLSARLVDRIELFMAPRILGQGKSWCELQIKNPLSSAPGWEMKRIRKLGDDVQLSLRPSNHE